MIEFSKLLLVKCVAATSVLLVGMRSIAWFKECRRRKTLEDKAAVKFRTEQEYINHQMKQLSKDIDLQEVERIFHLSTKELLQKIAGGILKPLDVVKIFLYKACKVTQRYNCVTDVIKDNFETAQSLQNKDQKSCMLYGLPVSLKECFDVKNAATTLGLVNWINNVASDDCVLIKVLKHCGAIPFVRTNLSQVMFGVEANNPIYGETSNPHNPAFGPGGSSSGEGCIIAAGASVLGFGTDMGGSVRVPSHLSGICGLKPTQNRISAIGLNGTLPGFSAIKATLGPMARDVDTIVVAMKAILCEYMFRLDPYVIPIPFREMMYSAKEPLRIGYYDDDGYVEPIPACKRAVKIAKSALEQAGHILVPYKVPDVETYIQLTLKAVCADGCQTNYQILKHDLVAKSILYIYNIWRMSLIRHKLTCVIMNLKYPRLAKDLKLYGGGDRSAASLLKNRGDIEVYKQRFFSEWREKYKIDAVICPTYPLVACHKGNLENGNSLMSYSILHTLVDCPAGTVPVTKVTQQDIEDLKDYKGHYDDPWDNHFKKACKDSINMPVGVQCVSYPWHEEIVLRLMKEVETLTMF